MKTNKVVVVIAFLLAAGVGFAQGARGMGGGGISGQPIDGTVIKPRSVQASGTQDQFMCTATTAVCEVESSISAATMTSTVPAFDIGPTATPGANDRLACFSYGPSGSKTRMMCVDAEGDINANSLALGTTTTGARASVFSEASNDAPSAFSSNDFIVGRDASSGANSGAVFLRYDSTNNQGTIGVLSPGAAWRRLRLRGADFQFINAADSVLLSIGVSGNVSALGFVNSQVTSGNQAYTCTNVGCRLSLGNTGRYFYDTGVDIGLTGANLYLGSATQLIYVAKIQEPNQNATLTLVGGKSTSAADSVGITLQTRTQSVAGAKIASFQNGTSEVSFIDYLGNVSGNGFVATTATGSALTGGGASGPLLITSNTPDSHTSSTVPAIKLQASQNITDSDLLMTVEDSAGNRRAAISELGNATFSGNVIAGSGMITNFFNQSGYGSRGHNAITIPDDGAGTPAAYTWQPQFLASITYFTCNDANGCEITMSLGTSFNGIYNRAFNVGTNIVTFKDTAGVSEMAGDFAMGQHDTIEFIFANGRFVEINRSDN